MTIEGSYDYVVDRSDAIARVSDEWLAFACENGAPGLTPNSVLGHSLWEFVVDRPTQEAYRRLHTRVRDEQQPVVVSLRCDSACLRRDMRMVLTPLEDNAIAISSRMVRVAPREPIRLLDPHEPRSDDVLTICSFCKRALIEGRGWIDIEQAEELLAHRNGCELPRLQYATCDRCPMSSSSESNE